MGRLILALLVIVVVAWLVVRSRRARSGPTGRPMTTSAELVRCAECGVHLPRAEAYPGGDHHYCCNEHLTRNRERTDG